MPPTDPNAAIALLHEAAATMLASPLRHGSVVRIPARGSLLATGDLHDNPVHLRRVLVAAALERGPDRHVILHELIHGERLVDGADLSHRMLLRAAELVMRFPRQVHPLLANHEISQLTGRSVSKGAGDSVVLFEDGLDRVFGDDWEAVAAAIRVFIAAMPLALRSDPDPRGRVVLCAHSLPAPHAMARFDFGVFDRPLDAQDFAGPTGAAYLMTWGRGLDATHLARLGERLGVSLFCLGHQHAETGVELIAPNAIVINSDHERGAVVPLDLEALPSAEEAAMLAIPLAGLGDGLERGKVAGPDAPDRAERSAARGGWRIDGAGSGPEATRESPG
ncbi:MAG: hypothetical protein U0575_13735 [Phycisphaerales bacterium]|jgi:hypothetical protein